MIVWDAKRWWVGTVGQAPLFVLNNRATRRSTVNLQSNSEAFVSRACDTQAAGRLYAIDASRTRQ